MGAFERRFPGSSDGKASACNTGDLGLNPGLGRSPEEGNGNPLQYSCLEKSMDGGAWLQATVHGITKSQTRLSSFTGSLGSDPLPRADSGIVTFSNSQCIAQETDLGICLKWGRCLVQNRVETASLPCFGASQMVLVVKNLPANAGDTRDLDPIPGSGRFPWSRKWQPALVSLPGKSHGQRNLVGYSPWDHKESGMTEWLNTHSTSNRQQERSCKAVYGHS